MKDNNSNFFDSVYQVVKLVPKGKVTTYGAVANYLGSKGSARMVGWAMNAAHQQPGIPAHRVVNRNGFLTGKNHFRTPDEMERLLNEEGIDVKNDQLINFDQVFWDPAENLTI